MESALFFLATVATATTLQRKARETILKKWQEGSLSYEELKILKQLHWFQKLWKPTQKSVSVQKKQN
jgi:hypothetical protein